MNNIKDLKEAPILLPLPFKQTLHIISLIYQICDNWWT